MTFTAPSGRRIAVDVVGNPDDPAVVYLHGTPDSRVARHPDDDATRAAGICLLALDRPGFGDSTLTPDTTQVTFAHDVVALLDHLQIATVPMLSWSAGTTWALGIAATAPSRVSAITAVGGLVPVEAFADPSVVAEAGATRMGMVETAHELGPTVAGELIGGMLVPDPISFDAAIEHLHAGHAPNDPPTDPAFTAQMARALCDAVKHGVAGIMHDVALQFTPLPFALADVAVPVTLINGDRDTVCPPAFAHWYARHLPDATVDIRHDAGHLVLLEAWTAILTQLRDTANVANS